jgi:hypothetical protein
MGESIKEECLKFFLTKETFYALLKYLIPILAFFMVSAVTYGINEMKDRNIIKTNIHLIQKKQDFMTDTVINQLTRQSAVYTRLETKLDTLLRKLP